MSRKYITLSGLAGALYLAAASVPASAQTADRPGASPGQEQRSGDDTTEARMKALEARIGALETLLKENGITPLSDEAQAAMRGRGLSGQPESQPAASSTQQVVAQNNQSQDVADEENRKAPAPTQAVETISEREQGYFGSRVSVELGVNYSHFDDARVNLSGFLALDSIFLGLISIDEAKADIVTTDLAARVGFGNRLQFDVDVPYLVRHAYYQSGGAGGNASGLIEASKTQSGLGDISFGASYRLFTETFTRPDVVVNIRGKAPTGRDPFGIALVEVPGSQGNLSIPENLSFGTGVWSASGGISVLKSLDPIVVFGSVTYFWNFQNHFDDIDEMVGAQPGEVNIGNAIQYGAGVAFALNERSSLSTSFTQRFVSSTRLKPDGGDWQKVVGSGANVALLNFGATFSLSDRVSLLANVSIGMTADAPDMIVGLRLPIRF